MKQYIEGIIITIFIIIFIVTIIIKDSSGQKGRVDLRNTEGLGTSITFE